MVCTSGSDDGEHQDDDFQSDSDVADVAMETIDEENNAEESGSEKEIKMVNKSVENLVEFDVDAVATLRNQVRRLLNCVSEAQMSRTISDLVNLFNDQPRALVRKVLIEEIDILLGVSHCQ